MIMLRRLASQSSILFGSRIIGAGIVFLAQVGIARLWGAHALGNYMLIMAVMNIIMVFLPLGFQTIGTYFAAEYRAHKDRNMLHKFLWQAYSHVVIMGALVSVAFAFYYNGSDGVGHLIKPFLLPIMIMAISIAAMYVSNAILVGLKRPFAGFFVDAFFRPILVISAFALSASLFSGDAALLFMIEILAIGFCLLSALQFLFVAKTLKRIESEKPKRKSESKRWWRFALPWVLIALATDFFFDIDLIILSGFLENDELAVFGVISRIFILVSFGIVAVYAITVPDIFESEANNDREGFLQKVGDANLVASGLSLVLVIGVAIFGSLALKIFGEEFVIGAQPLVLLCLALLVRSIFGPASLVLSIYDKPYASLPSVALGLFSLVALNYVFVPKAGVLGAAIAALLAITIWSISQWLVALKVAKVDISIYPTLKKYTKHLFDTK